MLFPIIFEYAGTKIGFMCFNGYLDSTVFRIEMIAVVFVFSVGWIKILVSLFFVHDRHFLLYF